MHQSRVVEIGGVFLGAAVPDEAALRFVAIDPRVEELDGSSWPTIEEIRRVAGFVLRHGRLPHHGASAGTRTGVPV